MSTKQTILSRRVRNEDLFPSVTSGVDQLMFAFSYQMPSLRYGYFPHHLEANSVLIPADSIHPVHGPKEGNQGENTSDKHVEWRQRIRHVSVSLRYDDERRVQITEAIIGVKNLCGEDVYSLVIRWKQNGVRPTVIHDLVRAFG